MFYGMLLLKLYYMVYFSTEFNSLTNLKPIQQAMPVIARRIPPQGDEKTPIVKPAVPQNHHGEEAARAFAALSKKIGPLAFELLELGRSVDHPIFKACARSFECVTNTPLTQSVEDLYCEKRSRIAAMKVSNAIYPPNLVSMKNTIKNKLKNAVYEWQVSYRPILNKNAFLKNRVAVLSGIIDFVEKYNTGDAKQMFDLIGRHNAILG